MSDVWLSLQFSKIDEVGVLMYFHWLLDQFDLLVDYRVAIPPMVIFNNSFSKKISCYSAKDCIRFLEMRKI